MLRWVVSSLLLAAGSAATSSPTPVPTPFVVPTLEQIRAAKATALYPSCRAELLFVVDVSGSVSVADQKTLFTFVDEMIVAVEKNIEEGRYGVVVFGINNGRTDSKVYTTGINTTTQIPKPWGNDAQQGGATEVLLKLDTLKYDCAECKQQNGAALPANWSQLDVLYNIAYKGDLTPTWSALDMAFNEYNTSGDPTIPGRFVILLTDGVPNDGGCTQIQQPACAAPINFTNQSVARVKEGSLLLTVFIGPDNATQLLMREWASEPRDLLAITPTGYAQLVTLIPNLVRKLCPGFNDTACVRSDATSVDIPGSGFLDTGLLRCRFYRSNQAFVPSHETAGQFVRDDLIRCALPTVAFTAGEWRVNFTENGATYHTGPRFNYANCDPADHANAAAGHYVSWFIVLFIGFFLVNM